MWKSKERKRRETFERALQEMIPAAGQVSVKWLYFGETLPFKEGLPLREQVRIFSHPLAEFFRKAYPSISKTDPEVYLSTLLIGIYLARTHPIPEVLAVAEYLDEQSGVDGIAGMLKAFVESTPNR